jgi:hypothetical protein
LSTILVWPGKEKALCLVHGHGQTVSASSHAGAKQCRIPCCQARGGGCTNTTSASGHSG